MEDKCGKHGTDPGVRQNSSAVCLLPICTNYLCSHSPIFRFTTLFSTCFTLEDYDLGMCEGAHCGTSGAELCVQVWIREDLLIIASLGVTGSKSKVRLSVTHTSVIVACDSSAERNLKKCKPYGRSFLKSAGLKIFASAPGARGDVHHGSPDGFCRKRGLDSDYGTIGLYYWYNFSVCLKATYVLS